jgi:hypothetical protein
VHVIARNSSFTYKGKSVDVKQVGRDLGVRYVLEGSVRKAGNRVRVTGQLIDAANGAHIWADRFALLASCYGHLGRTAEAQAAWAEVVKIAPDFSIERRRRVLPFRNPDHFEYRIEGMRKAGLPV